VELGISSSTLGKYEADDFKDISPFSLKTLAKSYGVSTDYLLGLTEQKITQAQLWTSCT
jgi:transcriptional regulator with XRE-family HTH domain